LGHVLVHCVTRSLLGWSVALLLWLGGSAFAAVPDRTVFQYKHTGWSVTDGAPPAVYALAQGRDGYLWVGSSTGLYRFDGVSFERIALRNTEPGTSRVSALLAAGDGSVWVGYDSGKIAVYSGSVLRLDRSAPRSDAYVMNLVGTQDGAVWAQLGRPDRALLRRSGGRWQQIGADWGLPREWLIDTFVARNGSLWVTTLQSVLVLRIGARHFEQFGAAAGHATVSQDPEGRIWLSDDRGTRILVGLQADDSTDVVFPTPAAARNFRARFDRQGNLWAVNADGLFRIRAPAAIRDRSHNAAATHVERFTKGDGLTSDKTVSILEDREGNIWVGTSLGLDRFRAANVVMEPSLTRPPQWGFSLHSTADGVVYVSAADALYRVLPGEAPEPMIQSASGADALCGDSHGSVWVIMRGEILRIRQGVVTRMTLPSSINNPGIEHCVVDDRGVLWMNAERNGLYSVASGRWRHHPPSSESAWALTLTESRDRRPIALLKSGALVRLDLAGKPAQTLSQHDAGEVTLVQGGRGGLMLGGTFGLGRVDSGTLRIADGRRFPWLVEPTGLVETPSGQTWLLAAEGIIGLPTADLERAFHNPNAVLRPNLLDFEDGLPNISNRGGYHDAVLGGDGRIWFATISGVAWVDPAGLARNRVSPPVAIRGLVTKDRNYQDPTKLILRRGTSNLTIQYAGLSLTVPKRVRFRYQLEGVDEDWVDAGNRREAYYTNLGPGTYRFRVVAANNDGVWNHEGAALDFTIPPTFIQSIWFKLLCLFGLGLLAGSIYTLRLRQETARLQSRFDIRIAERERIARELHDTLLQGFQGLVLRFQSVANRTPPEGDLRASIEEALDRADAVLIEGRARVRELRSDDAEVDLSQALLEVAADIVESDSPRVELTVEGAPQPLHPIVLEEALRIGEEAIRNAVWHARASKIEAVLTYGRHELRMVVRDDGIGMPQTVLAAGKREDHFGLVGMRERAARIGGRLAVSSGEGRGTEVALILSARAAYTDCRIGLIDKLRSVWLRRRPS
jgi:signal transduction histidine kinase/streptogramin lyase